MGAVLGHLKPELVWNQFEEICKHPRPSRHEEKIVEYILAFGKKNNLETFRDDTGNVIIRKPATPGKENLKAVVLQGHMDMVCEKNRGVEHDFDNDPLDIYIDGDWVRAKGTTLGADNGIGVAAALAVLEDKTLEHGPLECLFTYDEETSLAGAGNLKAGVLKADILLNLDSEEEGILYIGCAGGKNTTAKIKFTSEPVPADSAAYEINVNGLLGGHSGIEINQGRANAVKILTRLLWNARKSFELRIANIEGGNKHNAIPREAFAIVTVPKKYEKDFLKYVAEYEAIVKEEFATVEKSAKVFAEAFKTPQSVIDVKTEKKLLCALYGVAHGVLKMSADIPELVETSTNLATVITKENYVEIVTSQRSSVNSEIQEAVETVSSVFHLADAEVTNEAGYPGWKPNVHSEILEVVKASYKKLFGKEAEVKAIHAGLETGLISEKYPDMDMLSFGPTMIGVHSPDEKLEISSVGAFYKHLADVLANIPKK
jgi:dipeptidase D